MKKSLRKVDFRILRPLYTEKISGPLEKILGAPLHVQPSFFDVTQKFTVLQRHYKFWDTPGMLVASCSNKAHAFKSASWLSRHTPPPGGGGSPPPPLSHEPKVVERERTEGRRERER